MFAFYLIRVRTDGGLHSSNYDSSSRISIITFVFFDKFFAVMVNKSNLSPILGAWIPNFVFLILALYFLKNAKK